MNSPQKQGLYFVNVKKRGAGGRILHLIFRGAAW